MGQQNSVDLSSLSDSDLQMLAKGNIKMMSTKGLEAISNQHKPDSVMSRIGTGIMDPVDALAQIADHALPQSVSKGIDEFSNKYIAPYSMGLVAKMPEGGFDEFINQKNAKYHAPEGVDWARMGGNIVSPVNLAIASKIPVATSLAGKVLTGIGTGAATGAATTPVVGDAQKEFLKSKIDQAKVGAITGGAIPLLTNGLSRVISPKMSTTSNPQLELLRNEGVNPTIGQSLGGNWNKAEEKLQSLPIVGDMISNARRNANSQFEKAAINRSLSPIGQSLPSGLSGRDAISHVQNVLGDAYDNVLNKIGAITPDIEFGKKLSSLKSMVDSMHIPQEEKNKFIFSLDRVANSIDSNGVITSDAFKNLESELGRHARNLGSSQNNYENSIAGAVKQVQSELRDMLSRQAGRSADELQQVNNSWANFKRIQNASSKIGAENGQFTPAQFLNAVRAMDKTKDKSAFAKGVALGQDLADAGKSVLGNKVPDSGTAGRLLMDTGALGAWVLNPAIPLSLISGGALYTQPAQRLLNDALAKRPALAAPLAQKLRESGDYLLPASGAIGLGLLNQ